MTVTDLYLELVKMGYIFPAKKIQHLGDIITILLTQLGQTNYFTISLACTLKIHKIEIEMLLDITVKPL